MLIHLVSGAAGVGGRGGFDDGFLPARGLMNGFCTGRVSWLLLKCEEGLL